MRHLVVETNDDQVLRVVGLYDKRGEDTDDLLKAETLVFEAPNGGFLTIPYCHGGVHVVQ